MEWQEKINTSLLHDPGQYILDIIFLTNTISILKINITQCDLKIKCILKSF